MKQRDERKLQTEYLKGKKKYQKSVKGAIKFELQYACDANGNLSFLLTRLFDIHVKDFAFDFAYSLQIFTIKGAKRQIENKYPFISKDENSNVSYYKMMKCYYGTCIADVKTYYRPILIDNYNTIIDVCVTNSRKNYVDKENGKKVVSIIPQIFVDINAIYDTKKADTTKVVNVANMIEYAKDKDGNFFPLTK